MAAAVVDHQGNQTDYAADDKKKQQAAEIGVRTAASHGYQQADYGKQHQTAAASLDECLTFAGWFAHFPLTLQTVVGICKGGAP
jgi:hypothetical protein